MSEAMQPGPLSDSDIFALKEILLEISVRFVLHVIYSALVMIVLYKLWTNKAQLTAHHILIAAVISMFVFSTGTTSGIPAYHSVQLMALGCDPPNVERPLINMDLFFVVMTRLNYLIGDSIVVWRAWVLWTNHSRVHMLLCICLFGTFVGVTVDLAFSILYQLSEFSDSPRFSSLIQRALILFLPLFLTNFISTCLMAYKVCIYCLLWLSMLIFALKTPDDESLPYAMYPITIILLVTLDKGNLESTVNGTSFSQSLQFASRPQTPTATQTDDVAPDSTTTHIASVMPDSDTDDRLDSNTNDIAVAKQVGEKMEKNSFSHFG
ncbi:hypothetical protein C8J56DRAFT_1131826 [Mycena floridula]|nr:hypothetical protein C8J56DRAFT_1131826 [Mycena floridula]